MQEEQSAKPPEISAKLHIEDPIPSRNEHEASPADARHGEAALHRVN